MWCGRFIRVESTLITAITKQRLLKPRSQNSDAQNAIRQNTCRPSYGAVHKVRHAIFGQFLPPCHTSSHIPGPPRKYVTHLRPPRFWRLSTKNPDKSPLVQILSQLFAGVFVRGGFVRGLFMSGRFCPGWFLSVPVLSEYIRYIRKLNIT